MAATIQIIMVSVLFIAGVVMVISGMLIIMTREYQETMRVLSNQSTRLSSKALSDAGVQASLDGTARWRSAAALRIRHAHAREGQRRIEHKVSAGDVR